VFSADIAAVGDANSIETVKFTFDGNEFDVENDNGTYSATVAASAMTVGNHEICWEAIDANGINSKASSTVMVAGKQVLGNNSLDIIRRIFAFRYTTKDADGAITSDGLWDLNNLGVKSNNSAVRVDSYSRASVEMWGSYDLSGIPSDKRIVKAEIVLGLYEPSNNPNPTLGIYEVLDTFEQNITDNIPQVSSEPIATVALQKDLVSEEGVTKTAKGFRSIANDGYPEHLTDFDTVVDITSLLDKYMDEGKTELNICVKGVSTAQIFAKNPQILLTYADERNVGATVTKVGNTHRFTATFTGDEADEPVVIFAVYNGTNLIKAVIADDYHAEIAGLPDTFKYKCFVWNSLNSCTPLADAFTQIYTK